MADIWLTAAAEAAFSELQATAPAQAGAVSDAINHITAAAGRRIDLPGAPAAEPFLAIEPRDPDAPAVLYRHAANGERACRLGQLCLPEVIQPGQSQQDWDCKNSQENQDAYYLAHGLRNLKASIHSLYAMHFL